VRVKSIDKEGNEGEWAAAAEGGGKEARASGKPACRPWRVGGCFRTSKRESPKKDGSEKSPLA